MKAKNIMIGILMIALSGCGSSQLNSGFYNDYAARKKLYENGKEPEIQFDEDDSYKKELIDQYYLCFQERGISTPNVNVILEDNVFSKSLDSSHVLKCEIEDDETNYQMIATTSLMDENENVILQAKEIAYYDGNHDIYAIDEYNSNGECYMRLSVNDGDLYKEFGFDGGSHLMIYTAIADNSGEVIEYQGNENGYDYTSPKVVYDCQFEDGKIMKKKNSGM